MPDKRCTYCFLTLLMVSVSVYASSSRLLPSPGNPKESTTTTAAPICKVKSCKVHTEHKHQQKAQDKNTTPAAASPANTFENFIAPFIRTISPHFYDKILKKEEKLPESMRSREA